MSITYNIVKKAQDVSAGTLEVALAPSLSGGMTRCTFKLAVGAGASGIYGITEYGRLTGLGYAGTDELTIDLLDVDALTYTDGAPDPAKEVVITVADLLDEDLDTALTDSE